MQVKHDDNEFRFGAVFGFLLGASICSLVYTFPTEASKNYIFNYQTLITGVLAVMAASASAAMLQRQIRQQKEIERERVLREQKSARPLLSFALVLLLDYSEISFKRLRKLCLSGTGSEDGLYLRPVALEIPDFPKEIFDVLEKNLKFGSNSASAVISRLLQKLQIQHSRLQGMNDQKDERFSEIDISEIYTYMTDCLELTSLTTRLFPYSRNETSEVDEGMTFGHLFQAGTLAVDFESQDPFVLHLMKRYPQKD